MYAYIHTFKIAVSLVNSLPTEHDCVTVLLFARDAK